MPIAHLCSVQNAPARHLLSSPLPGAQESLPPVRQKPGSQALKQHHAGKRFWMLTRQPCPVRAEFHALAPKARRSPGDCDPRAGPWPTRQLPLCFCFILPKIINSLVIHSPHFPHLPTCPQCPTPPLLWVTWSTNVFNTNMAGVRSEKRPLFSHFYGPHTLKTTSHTHEPQNRKQGLSFS